METPMLVIQNREDANDVLARRISVIYSKFDGGLGEFFERLRHDQQRNEACSSGEDEKIGRRIKEMAICGDNSDCGND